MISIAAVVLYILTSLSSCAVVTYGNKLEADSTRLEIVSQPNKSK